MSDRWCSSTRSWPVATVAGREVGTSPAARKMASVSRPAADMSAQNTEQHAQHSRVP